MGQIPLCRLALVLLAAVPSLSPGDGGHSLAPVIVSEAPRNAAATLTPEDETGMVRVIEREAFANRITTLADTLATQTGVQVRRLGGLGSYSEVSIRGSSSKQVQVYLDGMLLDDPVSGGSDLSLYTLHDVAEIQVYPGNAPARYTQAGVGGVVAMTSLRADTPATTRINLGAGTHGGRRLGLFQAGAEGRFDYWLSLNRQQADNDFQYENRPEWFNPTDGEESRRRNADITHDDASARLGYRLSPDRRVDALLQWTDKDQGIPSLQNWAANQARLETRQQRVQFHYQDSGWGDGQLQSSHRLLLGRRQQTYLDRVGRIGTGTHDARDRTDQFGFNNALTWLLGAHRLSAGLDASLYRLDQEDRLQSEPETERERRQLTGALSHEWHGDNERWRTQAVLRRFQVRDQSDGAGTDSESRQHYHAWQLGARYAMTSHLWLFANVARQVRIPTLVEQFGQQGLFVGNPDLEAEQALNADGSLRILVPRGYLEVTGFVRDLDPAVTAIYDARGVGRYVNIAARVQGLELEASYDVLERWTLSANATTQESRNRSDRLADQRDKSLPGLYHHTARVKSTWRLAPFTASLSWHYRDELYYDSANLLEAEASQTVDADLGWRHVRGRGGETRINLEVHNLTDETWQDFNRFPGPGRTLVVNFQHRF
jgi:iron complex outermembrane receptor protein